MEIPYDNKDYIDSLISDAQNEVNTILYDLRNKIDDILSPTPEMEVHDIRIYSPQTPEEFEQMERNNRR